MVKLLGICLLLTNGHAFLVPLDSSRKSFKICQDASSFRTCHTPCRASAPPTDTSSSTAAKIYPSSIKEESLFRLSDWKRFYLPIAQFILHSFLLAVLLISWEDLTCSRTLPSRHRTLLSSTITTTATQSPRQFPTFLKSSWGQSTVRGLGFGIEERMQLIPDESASLPSYNEVMLRHRQERIQQWHAGAQASDSQKAQAIHLLVECYQNLGTLRQYANDYQWTNLRSALREEPWAAKLESAASSLRSVDQAVGFDWASCAWRHCGALADIQEALDELDALVGVLEPFEALFCLDIVERAVRDMLTEAPWAVAFPADQMVYASLPPYQAHRVFEAPNDPANPDVSEAEESWRLDEEYIKALQDLRIEDE